MSYIKQESFFFKCNVPIKYFIDLMINFNLLHIYRFILKCIDHESNKYYI